jgi:3-oxoadipate enol-lactonase
VIVSGETFNVRVEGPERAPVVMLSNSLGARLEMWDAQMEALTKKFRVVRYDSRGHGGSVANVGPYSIEQLARDALRILDALEVSNAHWLGLSMGGMVGQWLLSHAPARIDRAVLANTASHYSDPTPWNARIAKVKAEGMKAIASAVIARWFTADFLRDRKELAARFEVDLIATPAEGYVSCCAAIRDMDLREASRKIVNPTLVVVGTRDLATPPELGREVAANAKNAHVVELDAAHWSNVEQSDAFTRVVVDFLSGE